MIARHIWLLLPIALVGCGKDAVVIDQVFTPAGTVVVGNAVRVEASRIERPVSDAAAEQLSNYKQLSEPIPVNASLATKLVKALTDPNTYSYLSDDKACLFNPGVRITFEDDRGESLDVLFCFECDVIAVYRDDKCVGGEDCDDGRAGLLDIMKQIFPNDPAIHAISVDR